MQRPFGLAALTVLDLTPPQMVSTAADAGYSHVGIRLIPATPDEVRHDIVGDTALVRETAARLKDTGVKVLDIEIFRLKPDTRVEDYRPMLETGALFGASQALVAGNDPDELRLIDSFAAFCDLAAEYGIAPSLEPMPWTDVRDIVQGARVVDAAARPNGGVLIDPIHFDRADSKIADIAAVPASRFRYAQICDAPAQRPKDLVELLFQARCERLMPGEGGLDLKGIFGALPRDLPVSVEAPNDRLAKTMGPTERVRRLLVATKKLLESLHP
jgi:sugar phosphate isomerase/epimerase